MTERYYDYTGLNVAVLYSPGFGAGWFTWSDENEDLIFDPEIVRLVLDKKHSEIPQLVENKYDLCPLGWDQLEVHWVPKGTEFRIIEYDGRESIVYYRPEYYLTA